MSATIYKASQTKHVEFDELPPLCDYDASRHLMKRSYPVSPTPAFFRCLPELYPIVSRSVLWSEERALILGFGQDFQASSVLSVNHACADGKFPNIAGMSLAELLQAMSMLASPIGTNRLLT